MRASINKIIINFICLYLFFGILGCAALQGIYPNHSQLDAYIDKKYIDFKKIYGEPKRTTAFDKKFEIQYYKNNMLGVRGGIIKMIEPNSSERITTSVKSYVAGEMSKNSKMAIVSGNNGVPSYDLEFKKNANMISNVLKDKGLTIIDDVGSADFVILLKYGISDPKVEERIYTLPSYSWVPSQTTTTTGNVTNNYGQQVATISSTSETGGGYIQTGSTVQVDRNVSFVRYLYLEVIDYSEFKKTKKIVQKQKLTVLSVGPNGEFDSIYPFLAVEGTTWFSKASSGVVENSYLSNDLYVGLISSFNPEISNALNSKNESRKPASNKNGTKSK